MSATIQIVSTSEDIPAESDIEDWIRHTLNHVDRINSELTVRVVDEPEITELNSNFRHVDAPTDVLAFPSQIPAHIDSSILGDVVVCAGIVNFHISEYKLSHQAHWARIVAHGILHLCGYEHDLPEDEAKMTRAEADILSEAGLMHPELAEPVT